LTVARFNVAADCDGLDEIPDGDDVGFFGGKAIGRYPENRRVERHRALGEKNRLKGNRKEQADKTRLP
jgi:hypothetical protein